MSAVAVPAVEFAVTDVEPVPHAPVPLLRCSAEIEDPSGQEVYTVALAVHVQIDADRRGYDPSTRERLLDLFGEPERIPQTAGPLQLARIDTLVPSFRGVGRFTLDLPLSGDLELAATRYLASLRDGTVPLTFLFNGRVFYADAADRLQVTLVPWSASARFRLPVETWWRLLDERGFVRVGAETFDALRRRRVALGLPTLDATIAELLR